MPVTVKVNGTVNALVHKGSGHFSMATIPDVCKTPSPAGPVPIPYPNISQAATLDKGTSTVKADGGMMIATKGSEFSLSNGDNAGVAGGVKSSTFMKESTWILYSFDVKFDGQNACRFSDKKFQNHENTADLAGTLPVVVPVPDNFEEVLCEFLKKCTEDYDKRFPGGQPPADWCRQSSSVPKQPTKGTERGSEIDKCCEKKIQDVKRVSKSDFSKTVQTQAPVASFGGTCYPDVIAGTPPNCTGVWDFKTSCPKLEPGAPQPNWPLYGDGKKTPNGRFTRKTANEGWHGKTQAEVAKEGTGKKPVMIHENSEACQ